MRLSGVTTDITERKSVEERHTLLAREVDHRAKNALALVQSILRLTRADTTKAYVKAVEGRIAALSHAHTLLSESRWQGADLQTLVRDELAPYAGGGDGISIDGPSIMLQPATAQSLALIVHELVTNSAKYGALSDGGRLSIGWTLSPKSLDLAWLETGCNIAEPPKRNGFGINVVTATVKSQLRGDVVFNWR